MKCKKKLFVLSALSALTLIISSCTVSKPEDPDEPVSPVETYYRVEFQNYDGAFLYSEYVLENTFTFLSDLYGGPTPTRNDDDTYSYSFSGWNCNSIDYSVSSKIRIDKDTTLTATYDKTLIKYYYVGFVNYDGTILYETYVKEGDDAVYEGPIPTRPDDSYGNTYTFLGWSGTLTDINKDSNFVANYSSAKRKQTVKFLNYDDSILDIQTVFYGDTVTYTGDKPTRPDEGRYTYSFSGWDKPLINIMEDTEIHAQYSESDRLLSVTFVNYDGSLLDECQVYYGEDAVYGGTTPTRPPEGRYDYVFSNWSGSLENITGNIELRALFDKVDRSATDGLRFSYIEESNAYRVDGYDGFSQDVFVPKVYNGAYGELKVIKINDYAFQNKNITSIFLEDNIQDIGAYAFSDCQQLVNVRLPNFLRSIGDNAFRYCGKVSSLTLPSTVDSINKNTFYGFTNYLSAIKISSKNPYFSYEDGILYNRDKSTLYFPVNSSEFSKKTTYTIIDGVKRIESNAFYNYQNLRSIVFPDSLEEIGENAFYSCYRLKSIQIPENVEKIEKYAFYSCNNLTGELTFTSTKEIGVYAFYNTAITAITFADCPCIIGSYAFYNCNKLKNINFGDSVKELRDYCFASCSQLETVDLPSSVALIYSESFVYCSSLKAINVSSENETYSSIDGVVFTKDYLSVICYPMSHGTTFHVDANFVGNIDTNIWRGFNVESFEVDSDNTKYSSLDGAIYSKDMSELILAPSKLTSYVAPSSLITIRDRAFYGNDNLKMVDLSESSIENLSEYLFYDCDQLEQITLPDTLTSIGSYSFYDCSCLTSISMPSSTTSIGYYAFSNCNKLNTITLNDGLTTIQYYAFSWCSELENIEIPATVNRIEDGVFYGCSKIKSIDLSKVVNYLNGYQLFRGCTSLATIKLPNNLSSIDSYMFYDCTSLTSIDLPANVNQLGTECFRGCSSLTDIDVSNITWTGDYVFYGCSSLTEIQFNDNCNLNCSYMFYDCTSLTTIKLPKSQNYIAEYMFYNCTSLTSITLPDSLQYIYNSAFDGCSALTELSLPNSLYSINSYAFHNCTSLTSITLPDSLQYIYGYAFDGCSALTELSLPNSLVYLGEGTFRNCTSLTSIAIPSSVIEIYTDYLFYNCTSLVIASIGRSVSYIGNQMFYNCTSLMSVTVDYNSVNYQAFYNCSSLNYYLVTCVNIADYAYANMGSVIIGNPSSSPDISAYAFVGTTIYFEGSESDWNNYFASRLVQTGTVYFLSESEPEEEGKYWHYVNGQPVIWVIENNE